jgi:hypothetical protein
MMKTILAIAALAASSLAYGQVCDVTYTVDTTAIDAQGVEHDVGTAIAHLYGVPLDDLKDNSAKMFKVVDTMSKLQDSGGPYMVETGEVRSCDGKPPERVLATSVLVKGLTLKGSNKIAREALKQADLIVKRYENRAARGAKMGWDHGKARKTPRDDVGKRKDQP